MSVTASILFWKLKDETQNSYACLDPENYFGTLFIARIYPLIFCPSVSHQHF